MSAEPLPKQSQNVHEIAVSGFKEGTNDLYDQARPSYPASALRLIAEALPPASQDGLTILEPGSGTGIFSRIILSPPTPEYPSFPVKALIGIEPSEGMRNAWQRGLGKIDSNAVEGRRVIAVDGSFEDFSNAGVKKGSVDLVVIAQAWHWCPDYDKALREVAEYLSPTGILVLIWNLESNHTPWHARIRELYQPHDRGTPQYYKGWWRRCYETPAYAEFFQPPEERTTSWVTPQTEDQLVNRLLSKSYLTEAYLSGQEREDFVSQLRQIIQQDDKEWIDKEKRIFAYHYNTDVIIIRKKE